jgi:predicted nucleotidyltransferase
MSRAAGGDWWITTVKGNALANASFGKPVSRATAARLLAEVIERARSCNAGPARLLTITEIVVFGSYLDPASNRLRDLDLAVSTVRRDTGGQRHVDKVLEYARTSGRSLSAFHDRLLWPARELRMMLKNRSSAISITDEDIRKLTDRFEVAYAVGDDPDAIPRHRTQFPKPDPARQQTTCETRSACPTPAASAS